MQTHNVSFAFGARTGAAIANIDASYNDYYSSKSRTGFYLGLVYHMPISRSWAFQPEAYFGQQGAIVTHSAADPNFPGETEMPVKLSYLNLPLKFAYLLLVASPCKPVLSLAYC